MKENINKKKILVILLFVVSVIISIPFWIVISWHLQITNFKEGIVDLKDSFDGQYTIQLSVEEDDYIKLHYANVTVLDNDTGEVVFSIKNEYRAFDFQWVVWKNETYNFWLKSGDIGTFYYEFQSDNKTWKKYSVTKEDTKYYTLSDSIKGNKIRADIEDVTKGLPEGYNLLD